MFKNSKLVWHLSLLFTFEYFQKLMRTLLIIGWRYRTGHVCMVEVLIIIRAGSFSVFTHHLHQTVLAQVDRLFDTTISDSSRCLHLSNNLSYHLLLSTCIFILFYPFLQGPEDYLLSKRIRFEQWQWNWWRG